MADPAKKRTFVPTDRVVQELAALFKRHQESDGRLSAKKFVKMLKGARLDKKMACDDITAIGKEMHIGDNCKCEEWNGI